MPIKLTAKQEKYAQNRVSGMNQSDAYRDAYPNSINYKQKTINEKASQLESNGKIKARIKELMQPILEKVGVKGEDVIRELSLLSFTRMTDLIDFEGKTLKFKNLLEVPENIKAAIKEIKINKDDSIEIKLIDKVKPLELLARNLNLFSDASVNVNLSFEDILLNRKKQ